MNKKQSFYLIDHDLTEQDTKIMHYWRAIYESEVNRVARVIDYFIANPLKKANHEH